MQEGKYIYTDYLIDESLIEFLDYIQNTKMSTRKYKSGAEKRKLQLDREREENKCAKIHFLKNIEHKNDEEHLQIHLAGEKEGILSKENISAERRKPQLQEKNISDENEQV